MKKLLLSLITALFITTPSLQSNSQVNFLQKTNAAFTHVGGKISQKITPEIAGAIDTTRNLIGNSMIAISGITAAATAGGLIASECIEYEDFKEARYGIIITANHQRNTFRCFAVIGFLTSGVYYLLGTAIKA